MPTDPGHETDAAVERDDEHENQHENNDALGGEAEMALEAREKQGTKNCKGRSQKGNENKACLRDMQGRFGEKESGRGDGCVA